MSVRAILGPGSPAVFLGDVAHDCQTQTGPAVGPAPPAIHAIEAIEDTRQRFGRHARPVVLDLEQRMRRPAVDVHLNRARAVAGVAQCVQNQVPTSWRKRSSSP